MFKSFEGMIKKSSIGLVVWDVQEALVARIFNRDQFVGNVSRIIAGAREIGIPIFYTKITPLPERFEFPTRKGSGYGRFIPGDIIKEIYPSEDDIVLNKNSASIFTGTNFELMTRNAGINTLIFTGISTEIGVETSARHAGTLGYLSIIVSDAVSSGNREAHERSLKNMEAMMPVISTEELINFLTKMK
jgi:nicotinamidase-related amidase